MAKSSLKIQARELRKKGASVKSIAQQLEVSKSTASIWVRDIVLSVEQLEQLRNARIMGSERGRLQNALNQKHKRLRLLEDMKQEGVKHLQSLSEKELLITGLALYWGEGNRKTREVKFCNSDPKMIQFMLYWLQNCYKVDVCDIRCSIGINEAHRSREQIVRTYWEDVTKIPTAQFTKTSFKKVQNKKKYDNFHEHYGTLAISVVRPSRYYYKIIGYIEGLSEAGSGLVSRGVS